MSWIASGYVKKLKSHKNGDPLKAHEKLLMLLLADHHNEETNQAEVSLKRLARDSSLTVRGAHRILKRLELKGSIEICPGGTDPIRGKRPNRYRIPGVVRSAPMDRRSIGGIDRDSIAMDHHSKGAMDRRSNPLKTSSLPPDSASSRPGEEKKEQEIKPPPSPPADLTLTPTPQPVDPDLPMQYLSPAATEAWVVAAWNAIDGVKPLQAAIGPVRDRLRARLKQHPDRRWWEARFALVRDSDFLCGRTKVDFQASLYWVLGPTNEAKLLAGDYVNRPGGLSRQAAGIRTFLERDAR